MSVSAAFVISTATAAVEPVTLVKPDLRRVGLSSPLMIRFLPLRWFLFSSL